MSLPNFGVKNPVPVNLLMMALIIAGIVLGLTLRREFFPESDPEQAVVTLPYPGATPEEVEQSLAIKVEDKLIEVDDVHEVRSTLSEGGGMIIVEFEEGSDANKALEDVEREIDALTDLPDESEELRSQLLEPRLPVIQVAIFGDTDERTLKRSMRAIKEDLRTLPGMGELLEGGVRAYEIRVDVQRDALFNYGLSLPQVVEIIRNEMREVPGGTIRDTTGDYKVRTMGVEERAADIENIVIRSTSDGETVRLGEIANVIEDFVDEESGTRFNGFPAATLTVFKVGDQDIVTMAEMVRAYVDGRNDKAFVPSGMLDRVMTTSRYQAWELGHSSKRPLPPSVNVKTYSDLAVYVEGRLSLLTENAIYGALLVFATLLVFLNWRVAMWVGVGLATALGGTIMLMASADITLNLLTMFGLIIVIGLLVDDGIVVSENIQTRHDRGEPPHTAAVKGAEQVMWPVVATVLTTIVAFLPLTFIKGQIGTLLGALPQVVACALFMSLIECLMILPSHMAHSLESRDKAKPNKLSRMLRAFENRRDFILMERIVPAYANVLDCALRFRYTTFSIAIGVLIISFGLFAGRRVIFTFLPQNDAETVVVDFRMPIGSPASTTENVVRIIEEAALQDEEVTNIASVVGAVANIDTGQNEAFSPHIGQMFIELMPTDKRPTLRSSNQIIDAIRARLEGKIDHVERITFQGISGGPGGSAISIRVLGEDTERMAQAAKDLKQLLASYAGVFDIADDNDLGQLELRIELKPGAESLGFTRGNVATQIRGFLFGLDAHVYAANREDIDVRVRLDEDSRRSLYAIRNMWLTAPNGELVPLNEIATIPEDSTYATLRRFNRQRSVTVTADVASELSPEEIVAQMQKDQTRLVPALPWASETPQDATTMGSFERMMYRDEKIGPSPLDQIRERYPKLSIEFAGRQEQMDEAFASLPYGFMAAIVMIYVILAWLFSSYLQPIFVLTAVPFSIIGVIWGHYLLGYDMTFLSLIGFVALSGIVVNDSLILVKFYNEQIELGHTVHDALVLAGRARLRPILLTTITTVLGLLPLMLETSFQARFLIPMAIAIACGLISATFLILLVLPCLLQILDDVKRAAFFLWHGVPKPRKAEMYAAIEATD